MLTKETTSEQIKKWKAIAEEYRPKLSTNRKTGRDLLGYLKNKYPVVEIDNDMWRQLVIENLSSSDHYAEKLTANTQPEAIVFQVENRDNAKLLYQEQDEVFTGTTIIVGIELETAFFHVEGNSLLWDDLFAFRGLDESDLNNYYLVAEYISCLKRFDMLEEVLEGK